MIVAHRFLELKLVSLVDFTQLCTIVYPELPRAYCSFISKVWSFLIVSSYFAKSSNRYTVRKPVGNPNDMLARKSK